MAAQPLAAPASGQIGQPRRQLIVHGRDREEALARLKRSLGETVISGVDTTIPLFQKLLQEPDILSGDYDIHWLEKWAAARKAKA